MPFYADGRLEPRPVTLRAFATRTPSGWTVMPGGFARVGASPDTAAIAMQKGGRAADVWVLGSEPVERITLLPVREDEAVDAKLAAVLPSRAADNLFWLGRYIERAEGIVRVLRAYHGRFAEAPDRGLRVAAADDRSRLSTISASTCVSRSPMPCLAASMPPLPAPVASATVSRRTAGWRSWTCPRPPIASLPRVTPGDDASRAMTVLLRKLAGFAGLVHENMYHAVGWRFLEIGRRLERAHRDVRA